MLRVEVEITGCQCACNHCLTYGNKNCFNMSMKDIDLILKNMKDYSNEGFFFHYLMSPTTLSLLKY